MNCKDYQMYKMKYKQSTMDNLYILCSDSIQWLYEYDTAYVKSIVKGLIDLDNQWLICNDIN